MGERRLLEAEELTPVERQLCVKAAEGRLLDLQCGRTADDDPAGGGRWGSERQVRAQVLMQLLTGQGPQLAATVGAVRLRGAAIVGRLNLGGLALRCPLELYDCHLGGRLDLVKAEAPNISLRGSYLHGRLSARRLRVTHSLNLTGRLRCDDRVDLRSAHIGQLALDKATLTNPGGPALSADRLTVDGDLFLSSTTVTGEMRLLGAHLGGLALDKAKLINPDALTVDLERVSVAQAVRMCPAWLQGGIGLTHARVGGWYDEKQTWPEEVRLEGFVYEAIDAPRVTVKDRLGWLRLHQGGFRPQPYEQLAGVYRREGNEQAARTVAIAKQRARRADVPGWRRWPSRAWSWFLQETIGYGYRPAGALIPLAALFAAGWAIFDWAHPEQLSPARRGTEQPGFNPARYTADLLLPVVNFKQRDAFVAHGWVAWASFGFTFAGWLLTAVVVAGLTGAFKRD